jgi:hypothetical protein
MSRYRDAFEQHKVISGQFLKGAKIGDLCTRYGLQPGEVKSLVLLDMTKEEYEEQCRKHISNGKREANRVKAKG